MVEKAASAIDIGRVIPFRQSVLQCGHRAWHGIVGK